MVPHLPGRTLTVTFLGWLGVVLAVPLLVIAAVFTLEYLQWHGSLPADHNQGTDKLGPLALLWLGFLLGGVGGAALIWTGKRSQRTFNPNAEPAAVQNQDGAKPQRTAAPRERRTPPWATPEAKRQRLHHYLFAHKVLPSSLWEGERVLGMMANPDNQAFLQELWNGTRQHLGDAPVLPGAGLRYQACWLGGEHLAFLIVMPAVKNPPDAFFAAILTSPTIRYFVLENGEDKDGEPCTYLCEWDQAGQRNRNLGPEPKPTAFLKAVCGQLGIPPKVERPTPQQLTGPRKGVAVVDLPPPAPLEEADARQVATWLDAARAAEEQDDYAKAERLYRQVQQLWLRQRGVENSAATSTNLDVIRMLMAQKKYAEAEKLCQDWWRTSRRYRMLGSGETKMALDLLTDCYAKQGRQQTATAMRHYLAQWLRLSRGTGA